MKKICVITGTRAEYGLLRWVMEGIKQSPKLDLQIIATGMHLSPEFGLTIEKIESDGFVVDQKVEMLLSSDTAVGITKSMGLGMIGFADALANLGPDLVLVLGDRYEIFSAAAAAMVSRIPIAHLHGGEATEGLIDEPIRHSITKMSHLHFVAAAEYKKRVIQLGEHPDSVFLVGGLGVDAISHLKLLDRDELEEALNFKFQRTNYLITFHPVTLENGTSAYQMDQLLEALSEIRDVGLIFTMPNADTDGRLLFSKIQNFCAKRQHAKVYTSLGQLLYLSCISHTDGVLGNSSSGLTEVPSFKKGTVNIGERQRGRLKAESVIDCAPNKSSILEGIHTLQSPRFQNLLTTVVNPYGDGGASKRIVNVLENCSLYNRLKKIFYDLH